MVKTLKWTTGVIGLWVSILLVHGAGKDSLVLNALAYAGLTIIMLAAIHRTSALHAALSRMFALLGCSALAGVDTGFSGLTGEAAQKFFFAALLGIALVVLISRHAPASLSQRWLGTKT